MWRKELIEKIELQSIIVLIITFVIGYLLIIYNGTFSSIIKTLGFITIGFGVLYSFVSFFTINLRENYKDIILEYKTSNKELRSNFRAINKIYKESLKNTTEAYGSILPDNYRKQVEETTSSESQEN